MNEHVSSAHLPRLRDYARCACIWRGAGPHVIPAQQPDHRQTAHNILDSWCWASVGVGSMSTVTSGSHVVCHTRRFIAHDVKDVGLRRFW